jgi:hypothetical protein
MASVQEQIFEAVAAKLEQVVADLGWTTFIRNPRDIVGVDQMPAIVMVDGGSPEPGSLTSSVATAAAEFSTGLLVAEKAGAEGNEVAEKLLDKGRVAVSNALLDPEDSQLGGLAVGIFRGAMSDPLYGRPDKGAQWFGGQATDWRAEYWEREGDAEAVGP